MRPGDPHLHPVNPFPAVGRHIGAHYKTKRAPFLNNTLLASDSSKGVYFIALSHLQLLLFFSGGIIGFATIRMLQTGVIAAVIPMTMASFASELGGTGIGFLNSARFAGNGFGPLMATSVVAGANLLTLYLLIAVSTVGAVLAFLLTGKKKAGKNLLLRRNNLL